MEYLFELRKRLLYCLLWTSLLFSLLCFVANPLYQLLTIPLVKQFPGTHLIATQITAPFLVPIKFVFILSIFLLIPLFFYHLWAFISPALYPHEKRTIWILIMPSVVLFYSGMFFAYFVILPTVFRFFVNTTPSIVELLPDIGQYLDFSLHILFAFGLAFEVPIVVLVLVLFDVVSIQQLKAVRRYVIVLAFVIGMLVTPPDVLSQILLAIPMWLLYELGLVLAVFLQQKGGKTQRDLSKTK